MTWIAYCIQLFYYFIYQEKNGQNDLLLDTKVFFLVRSAPMFCGIYFQIFICKSCFVDCDCLQFNVTLDVLCQAAWLWHSDAQSSNESVFYYHCSRRTTAPPSLMDWLWTLLITFVINMLNVENLLKEQAHTYSKQKLNYCICGQISVLQNRKGRIFFLGLLAISFNRGYKK